MVSGEGTVTLYVKMLVAMVLGSVVTMSFVGADHDVFDG